MGRSTKKGPFVDPNLIKKVAAMESGKKEPIKTWARNSQIPPEFVGFRFLVHNGKNFIEVFVDCDIEVSRKRNPHGLIENSTKISGFDAPYEKSENPDVYIDTTSVTLKESISEAYGKVKKFLK